MRKGGFNMYLTKEKPKTSLYKNYETRFPKHKDLEVKAYVAYTIGNDMSGKMQSTVNCMAKMIAQGFIKGAD